MKNKKVKELGKAFQEFALKGSAFSTAIGIMLGIALKEVIDSLIDNILMPPIAHISSGIDFSDLFFVISRQSYESLELAKEAGELVVTYGEFINASINFLIVALVLFLLTNILVKSLKNALVKEKEEKKEARKCPYCLSVVEEKATRCAYCTSELK